MKEGIAIIINVLMAQFDKPFIFSTVSMVTGLLVMTGYITPKGAEALSGGVTFIIGASMVLGTSLIFHAHDASKNQGAQKSVPSTPITMTQTQIPPAS